MASSGKYIADRYSIKERLRYQGAMSETLKCKDYDEEFGTVVVKLLLRPDSAEEDLPEQMFHREVESLRKVANHKNVVKILDYGLDKTYNDNQGAFYIVLEFIDGKNLKEAIASHDTEQLSFVEKIDIIRQLFDGLFYIHSVDIVHRDIKPANIMRDTEGTVKILDFGISKIEGEMNSEFTTRGYHTELYCSPEQRSGKENITGQSDIYSLGLVLYELMTNKKIEKGATLQFDSFDTELQGIIQKMTMIDPKDRYRFIDEAQRDLFSIAQRLQTKKYLLIRTRKVIYEKLYTMGFIDAEGIKLDTDDIGFRNRCKDFLRKEFSGECSIAIHMARNDEGQYVNDGTYIIFGRQLAAHVKRDNQDDRYLFLISVFKYDPAQREISTQLSSDIRIVFNPSQAYESYNLVKIDDLSEMLESQKFQQMAKANKRNAERKIIESWGKIIELLEKKLDDEKGAIHYDEFEYNEAEGELMVHISPEDQNSEIQDHFPTDTMLQMTRKGSRDRFIDVGYMRGYRDGYLRMDTNEIDIDSIEVCGTVSISMRMEQSSIGRQKKAINSIKQREIQNPEIAEALFDPQNAKFKSNIILYQSDFRSSLIDESKKRSLEKALGSECIFLLQGPPGTGKTTFITELVSQIIEGKGKIAGNPHAKILIASQSHVAVDNAMSSIKKLIPDLRMIRIGREEKISDSSKDFTLDAYCVSWAEGVCERCDQALAELKEAIGVDDNLQKQHQLIEKIEEIHGKCATLREDLLTIDSKLEKTNVIVGRWNEINEAIKQMHMLVSQKAIGVSDEELITIMNKFSADIMDLQGELDTTLTETESVSVERVSLNEQRNNVTRKIAGYEEEEKEACELLGVNSEESFSEKKEEIMTSLAKKSDDYKLFSKIETLVNEWKEQIGKGQGLLEESLMDATLIGSTCLGLSRLSRVDFHFDWVIIDEAGKATPSELMVPMCLGNKVVLVGDHKQLPPVVDEALLQYQLDGEQLTRDDLEESLFEYLAENLCDGCKDVLTEQYRMHPAIGKLVSEIFYKNELKSKTDPRDKSLPIKVFDGKPLVWLSTASHSQRFERPLVTGGQTTYRNDTEIDIIFDYLLKIDAEIATNEVLLEEERINRRKVSVGIIAGYSAQRDRIIRQYESKYKPSLSHVTVEVNTVDAFQGRETDIIFYSIVRSNNKGNIGFLKDHRRLNVAFSRAMKLLIIVGDHVCAQKIEHFADKTNPFIKVIEFFKRNPMDCMLKEIKE